MEAVDGSGIFYSYEGEGSGSFALKDVSLHIKEGAFAAVLGHNGCGKTTLAKQLDALLPLQTGELHVAGIDVRKEKDIRELRRLCGMVFQNPDSQFVSALIEEDVAFGLENYDVPEEEIPERVKAALAAVGMEGFETRSPHELSGGQKQRIALAGVLAVEPELIVFDEATSMLDPEGRKELLAHMKQLGAAGKTVVMITHYVEEAVLADTVFLMREGKVLAAGTAREILTDRALLSQAGLLPPFPVQLYYDLKESGICLGRCPLTKEELVEELCRLR